MSEHGNGSDQLQFRPVSELMTESEDAVVIERRDPVRWQGALAEAVDRAVDDGDAVYLVEDGRRVAVIKPFEEG